MHGWPNALLYIRLPPPGQPGVSFQDKGHQRVSSTEGASDQRSNLDSLSASGMMTDRQPADSRSRFMSWVSK